MSSLATIRRIKDPKLRAERAAELLAKRQDQVDREIADIRKVRDQAGREMLKVRKNGKWVYRPADLARAMGMTRASVAERFPHAKSRDSEGKK